MTYTVVLQHEPEGGYSVTVPALPGCFTEGADEDEALSMAREAIECHLEALSMDGDPIPDDVDAFDLAVDMPTNLLVRHVKVGEALAIA
jgi:predicted RNase H-like HicB family nuclease